MSTRTAAGAKPSILYLERDSAEAEPVVSHLRLAGWPEESLTMVTDADEYTRALRRMHPDCILSGYALPGAGPADAPSSARRLAPGVPVIVVASAGEAPSVDLDEASGVYDVVTRDQLFRLVNVIDTSIRASELTRRSQAAEELLSHTFDSLADGVSIHSLDGTIIRANPQFAVILGVESAESLIGRSCHCMVHDAAARPGFCPMDSVVRNGHPVAFENYESQLGKWLSTTISPVFGADGKVETVVHVIRDITEKKAFELALIESEQRYRSFIENTEECICNIDVDGRFLYMTPGGLASHDLTLENVKGMHFTDLAEPEHHELLRERFDDALRSRKPVSFEYLSDTTRGVRWFQSTLSPVLDAFGETLSFVRVSRDVSERREVELALCESEQRYRSFIENTEECICNIDVDGRFLYMSPGGLASHDLTLETLAGMHFTDLAEPEHHELLRERFEEVLRTGAAARFEYRSDTTQGVRWFQSTLSPVLGPDGEVQSLIRVSRDVTETLKLQALLSQAQRLEAVGELAAGIAHEINTPAQYVTDNARYVEKGVGRLSEAIRSAVELLEAAAESGPDGEPGAQARAALALLSEKQVTKLLDALPSAVSESKEGLARIVEIVRAMKDFSHPGVKGRTPTDMNKALRTTLTVARNEYKYVADMVLELADELPLVLGRSGELNQVLLNLIVNAAHAVEASSRPDGRLGTITLRTRAAESGGVSAVEIDVEDDGTGMTPEVERRAFDHFFTTKEQGKGTGQGLAVAWAIVVEGHGGSIRVRTEPGAGTCFTISLPAVQDGEEV